MNIDSVTWAQAQADYASSGLPSGWDALTFAEQMAFVQRAKRGDAVLAPADVGFFDGVPEAEYHRGELGCASSSALKQIARTPSHYRAWVDDVAEREESEALLLGSALHCAMLEPEVYARDWVVLPAYPKFEHKGQTKEGRAERAERKADIAEWQADNAGKRAIDEGQRATVEAMSAALRAHPVAGPALIGGRHEVTLRWLDPDTGLRCKARADYWREDLATVFDLKTTVDASSGAFARSCANYNYHLQAAHYAEGFRALGKPLDSFVFVAVEKTPPYAVSVTTFGEATQEFARSKWIKQMRRMADCVARNEWPGYSQEIEVIELPAWALKEAI